MFGQSSPFGYMGMQSGPLAQLLQMQQMQGQMQGQMPQPQMPQGGQPDPQQQHGGHHGMNPLMMLSPLAGLFAANPKLGLTALSPGIGIANLLGAFK